MMFSNQGFDWLVIRLIYNALTAAEVTPNEVQHSDWESSYRSSWYILK